MDARFHVKAAINPIGKLAQLDGAGN